MKQKKHIETWTKPIHRKKNNSQDIARKQSDTLTIKLTYTRRWFDSSTSASRLRINSEGKLSHTGDRSKKLKCHGTGLGRTFAMALCLAHKRKPCRFKEGGTAGCRARRARWNRLNRRHVRDWRCLWRCSVGAWWSSSIICIWFASPLKNMSQLGVIFPIYDTKNQTCCPQP